MLHVLVCVTTPHERVLASLWLETRPNEQIYLILPTALSTAVVSVVCR